MSVMSSLRRKVYGVPPREERDRKFRFYRKVNAERGKIHQRARDGFDAMLAKKQELRERKETV